MFSECEVPEAAAHLIPTLTNWKKATKEALGIKREIFGQWCYAPLFVAVYLGTNDSLFFTFFPMRDMIVWWSTFEHKLNFNTFKYEYLFVSFKTNLFIYTFD